MRGQYKTDQQERGWDVEFFDEQPNLVNRATNLRRQERREAHWSSSKTASQDAAASLKRQYSRFRFLVDVIFASISIVLPCSCGRFQGFH